MKHRHTHRGSIPRPRKSRAQCILVESIDGTTNECSLLDPIMEPLYTTLMCMLVEAIDGSTAETDGDAITRRDVLVHAVASLVCTCKSGDTTRLLYAAAHAATVSYERLRMFSDTHTTRDDWIVRIDKRWFMCESASPMAIFDGPTTHPSLHETDGDRMKKWTMSKCVNECIECVSALEVLEIGAPKRSVQRKKRMTVPSGLTHSCPDMPMASMRVNAYTARMRAMMQCLRTVKPSVAFCRCHNRVCGRLMYRGEDRDAYGRRSIGEHSPMAWSTPDEMQGIDPSQGVYWRSVLSTGTLEAPPNPFHVFCGSACYMSWRNALRCEMEPLVSVVVATNTDAVITGNGRGCNRDRISRTLSATLRRNSKVAELIRMRKCVHMRKETHKADVKHSTKRLVRALNMDVALVYSAACIADVYSSREMGTCMVPGGVVGWRSQQCVWEHVLKSMWSMSPHIPTSELVEWIPTPARFIRQAKEFALNIYRPVCCV